MKTILITGASRGIGAGIATVLANNKNYNIILNYNKSENLAKDLEKKLKVFNDNVTSIKCDVSNIDDVKNMFQFIDKKHGGVDILINNAGISLVSQFQDTTPEKWREIFNVNVNGYYNTIYYALPHMLEKKSGNIINISSIWGNSGASCEVAYAATKGAINSLTKSLAVELAPSNIFVNAISPGVVDTDMMSVYSEEERTLIKSEIPLGKFTTPSEIGNLVEFLISDKNSYITGQIINIDGGITV